MQKRLSADNKKRTKRLFLKLRSHTLNQDETPFSVTAKTMGKNGTSSGMYRKLCKFLMSIENLLSLLAMSSINIR